MYVPSICGGEFIGGRKRIHNHIYTIIKCVQSLYVIHDVAKKCHKCMYRNITLCGCDDLFSRGLTVIF